MITIPKLHLKAALVGAGLRDPRPALNGVLVECSADETRCVGSHDPIVVVMCRRGPNVWRGQIIIPRLIVELMLAVREGAIVTLEPIDAHRWLACGQHVFTPIDAVYPDYRGAFVREVSGVAGLFDPGMFYAFGKVARALACSPYDVTLHQNGDGLAMVSIHGAPEFAGALQPMNPNINKAGRPGVAQWVRD